MKYVRMEGVTEERAGELSRAMAEKCYEASRLMALNTDFSRAFRILGGFVGAFGNTEFCESEDFTKCVKMFLAASQGIGRNKQEARVIMRFCLDAIRASFSYCGIFRVRDDAYSGSIPILTLVDNWLAREDSTLEDF